MLPPLARAKHAHFTPIERTDIPSMLGMAGALVWVDLETPTPEEVAILSDVFHFHQLTIDDCLNTYIDPPKVDDYEDYLFVIAQGIDFSTGDDTIATTELNLFIGQSYVV